MENTFLSKLGKRIAKLRSQKKLSQDRLAESSGLMINTVSKIEGGKTDSRITTYEKIAQGLDIELYKLFGDSNYTPVMYTKTVERIVELLNHQSEKTQEFIEDEIKRLLNFKKDRF